VIVVVGLGNIGMAIARRLVDTGGDVVGVEVAPERRALWRQQTGREAVADLGAVDWARVDRVFVIVRMTDQAGEVLTRLAALDGDRDRAVHLVTTLETAFAAGLDAYARPGLRVIEQPVSGGERGALAGTLTLMTAGPLTDDDEAFLRASIASHVVRFDSYGEPTRAKLLNNVTGAYNARALALMLTLAHEQGVDVRRFYDVLLTSSGGSWMAAGFLPLLDDLLAKDVHLLRDELGGLPHVDLDSDADLVASLGRARALLTGR
jgi:3-hydroxyisobutyrate dehydrogenase-like beta-hydroxyacid dehydrogenase